MALERYIYDTDEWFWVDTRRPCDDGRFPEIDVGKVLNEQAARVEELEAAIQRACDDDICPWARCHEDCPLYPYRRR